MGLEEGEVIIRKVKKPKNQSSLFEPTVEPEPKVPEKSATAIHDEFMKGRPKIEDIPF